jgi:3-hydroxyisobutyrate dehydrogenase-like beta-hydroxyacid dehydrogenase
MGSALARVRLRNGYRITVWNRTSARADPLVRDGAVLAPSGASAVGASPIVVVCVCDDKAANRILGTKAIVIISGAPWIRRGSSSTSSYSVAGIKPPRRRFFGSS